MGPVCMRRILATDLAERLWRMVGLFFPSPLVPFIFLTWGGGDVNAAVADKLTEHEVCRDLLHEKPKAEKSLNPASTNTIKTTDGTVQVRSPPTRKRRSRKRNGWALPGVTWRGHPSPPGFPWLDIGRQAKDGKRVASLRRASREHLSVFLSRDFPLVLGKTMPT